jgi:hypothetical protein
MERISRRVATFAMSMVLIAGAQPAVALAQDDADANFLRPALEIEQRLREQRFEVIDTRGSRAPGDRTQRVLLSFEDSVVLLAKWANADPGASAFNNEPRYDIAAYEIQKLFLGPDEFVVPPTVLRSFPLAVAEAQRPGARQTFPGAASVLVVLQYWLASVSQDNFWDQRRAQEDTLYARHIGNFNILTYLIRHQDANIGNYLISTYEPNPRVFAVDNGVAFGSEPSNRGFQWRELRVRRLPHATIERLRSVTRADLDRTLGVLAEYEIIEGELVAVAPGENVRPARGVRRSGDRIQIGLTQAEINAVERRLRNLVNQVERGRITQF